MTVNFVAYFGVGSPGDELHRGTEQKLRRSQLLQRLLIVVATTAAAEPQGGFLRKIEKGCVSVTALGLVGGCFSHHQWSVWSSCRTICVNGGKSMI